MSDGRTVFTNLLGMEIPVTFESVDNAFARTREFAARGFATENFPAGGYSLPYALAETFDWSLIGANHFTFTRDGAQEQALERLGEVYTRREFEAKTKPKKMPAKIKYSRGACESDPMEIRESATGDNKGYVTLIEFVGGGKSMPEFEKPKQQPARAPQTQAKPEPAGSSQEQASVAPAQAQAPRRDPNAIVDEMLSAVPLSCGQQIRALAKWAKIEPPALVTMIAYFAGQAPLSIDDVDALLAKIKETRAA